MAGATNGGDSARLGSHELEDGDGRGGRDGAGRFEGVREDKGADAEVGRDCRRVAPLAGDQTPVWRRGGTVKALESTVIEFKDFDSLLVN